MVNSQANSKTRLPAHPTNQSMLEGVSDSPMINSTKLGKIPENLQQNIDNFNIESEKLLLMIRDESEELKFQVVKLENEISELQAQHKYTNEENLMLKQEAQSLNENYQSLVSELQQYQNKQSQVQEQQTKLDTIERDFMHSIQKLEEQDELLKIKDSMITELRETLKSDLLKYEFENRKTKALQDKLARIMERQQLIKVEHVGRIKQNVINGAQQIDKEIIGKDLEIIEELIDQIRELCNIDNIDVLISSTREEQQRLMDEYKVKIKTLELDVMDLRQEYSEFRAHSEKIGQESQLIEQFNKQLKFECQKQKHINERQQAELIEVKRQLTSQLQNFNSQQKQLQKDNLQLQLSSQKALNSEQMMLKQIKENKKILANMKKKMLEMEGIIQILRDKLRVLEEQANEYEKKYMKMNPNRKNHQDLDNSQQNSDDVVCNNSQYHFLELKAHIFKQDEEIFVLKDMVKSANIQIKIKEQEISRMKKRLLNPNDITLDSKSVHNKTPSIHKKKDSQFLPSLNTTVEHDDSDSFKEPSKLEKLNQLSQRFKKQQQERDLKRHTRDVETQTEGIAMKSASTQMIKLVRKEVGVQGEVMAKKDEGLQTIAVAIKAVVKSADCMVQTQEALKGEKQVQTETKSVSTYQQQTEISQMQIQTKVIDISVGEQIKPKRKKKPKQVNEDSEYEYYEEEVEVTDEEDQGQNSEVPIYRNVKK